MSTTKGRQISDFSRYVIREIALNEDAPNTVNPVLEFRKYLIDLGVPEIESNEYAERNRDNVLIQIQRLAKEWWLLGVKAPIAVLGSSIITWKHLRFRELSDRDPIPENFPRILRDLRVCDSSRLLGYLACYLFCLGCKKIYITDQSHDGGIDLVGSFGSGPLSSVGFFVQAKAAEGTSTKRELLLSEYAKFLVLRRIPRWQEYVRALDLNESLSGFSPVYLFVTNAEFKPGLRDAALFLEAGLRTGRQIAAVISEKMTYDQVHLALGGMDPFNADLKKNLSDQIQKIVSKN